MLYEVPYMQNAMSMQSAAHVNCQGFGNFLALSICSLFCKTVFFFVTILRTNGALWESFGLPWREPYHI